MVLILGGVGIGVAAYLLSLHTALAGNPKRGLCTFTDTISCDKVLTSPYAEIAGIPVALIGLMCPACAQAGVESALVPTCGTECASGGPCGCAVPSFACS